MTDTFAEELLETLAKSGAVAPIHFARVMRLVPGYDPKNAPGIENQYFDSDGFPLSREQAGLPKEKYYGHD